MRRRHRRHVRRVSSLPIAHNPRRHRHNPRRHNPRKVTVINPRRRRRNPELKGLVKKSAVAAVGAMISSALSKAVPQQYMLGWTGIGVKLGIAYAVGWASERFVSREVAEMLAVGGAASAAGDAINRLLGMVGFQTPTVVVSYPQGAALPAAKKAAIAQVAQPASEMGDYLDEYEMGDVVEVTGPFTEYGDQGLGDIVVY